MKIEILNIQKKKRISLKELNTAAKKILRFFNKNKANVSIVIVDNIRMKQLNKRYRKKNKPTDVLTFSMREGKSIRGDRDLLGDIVISAEKAQNKKDIYLFLIHGMLHLLGYDHKDAQQRKKMLKTQTLLMEKICKSAAS